jgi:hypothetical protein
MVVFYRFQKHKLVCQFQKHRSKFGLVDKNLTRSPQENVFEFNFRCED